MSNFPGYTSTNSTKRINVGSKNEGSSLEISVRKIEKSSALVHVGFDDLLVGFARYPSTRSSYCTEFTRYSIFFSKAFSHENLFGGEQLPQEAPAVIDGKRPPESWPSSGEVDIRNLTLKVNIVC